MAGRNWSLSLQAATADYFEWMDSNDFSERVSPAPRPRRDVILLNWDHFPTESLTAHYQSPRGWESIAVRCCRGID